MASQIKHVTEKVFLILFFLHNIFHCYGEDMKYLEQTGQNCVTLVHQSLSNILCLVDTLLKILHPKNLKVKFSLKS